MTISELNTGLTHQRPDKGAPAARRAGKFAQSIGTAVFTLLVVAALVVGWWQRDDGHLTPERGTGYWLGMAGGIAMLLLLLYPLRKRYRVMRIFGSIPSWFRVHMMLGIIGPVLILFHANFKLGSANSNIALFSMLLVAGSGLIGRYLYGKIHMGLYGRKATVAECLAEAELFMNELGHQLPVPGHIIATMQDFSAKALAPKTGVLSGISHLVTLHWTARRCQRRLMRDAREIIANEGRARGWTWTMRRRSIATVHNRLGLFFKAVRRAAAFAVYERLFALWHVLHSPLFILLVLTATLHVIAVHTY